MLTVRSAIDVAECPVGDKIGSPVQGEAGVSLTQRSTQAHAAQGSVTLGPEQGEVGTNFSHLGTKLCLLGQYHSRASNSWWVTTVLLWDAPTGFLSVWNCLSERHTLFCHTQSGPERL